MSIPLLSLHLLVDEPEGVDVAWDVAEAVVPASVRSQGVKSEFDVHGQSDVNEQVAAASCDESCCCWGEDDSNL